MKKQVITLTLAAALAFGVSAFADDTTTSTSTDTTTQTTTQSTQKAWKDMSADEKKEFRAEVKKTWDNLTPEQQAEVKKEAKNKWKNMDPEKKKALIDKVASANGSNTTSTN